MQQARVLALTLVVLWSASPAQARPGRDQQLPNVPALANDCNLCHVRGGGTARNAFGLDVQRALVAGSVDWGLICDLDSDRDGATNGAELVDPDCTWRFGQPRPSGAIFNPADARSVPPRDDAGVEDASSTDATGPDSGAVDAGPSDAGPGPDVGPRVAEDDDGGCTCLVPSDPDPSALGALLLAGALVRARRRRSVD